MYRRTLRLIVAAIFIAGALLVGAPGASAQTTTLGDGTDGGNSTIGPGGYYSAEIDRFSLVTNAGTDTVTGMTVTLAGNASAYTNIATVDVGNTVEGSFDALSQAFIEWDGISVDSSNQNVYAVVDGGDIYKQTAGAGGANGGPVNIDDASNLGSLATEGRQVVRTSAGTLYSFVFDPTGPAIDSCEIWKSTDGSSWTEQDSANNPVNCFVGIGMAIDSSDNLHLVYPDGNGVELSRRMMYVTFSTSTDTFGTPETIDTDDPWQGYYGDIAIDSNDIPHVVYTEVTFLSGTPVEYSNRVGGSWKTPVVVSSGTNIGVSLVISDENIPEISYIQTISGLDDEFETAVGNVNNAASFTTEVVDASVEGGSTSIAVDSSGNTWAVYSELTSSYVTLVKHNDADAWTTWTTGITNSNLGTEPSIAIDGTDIYVFYQDDNDDVVYDMYNGSTWLGETVLQTGTFQDINVKWGYLNDNEGSTQIDYLYSDATDVYWASLSLDTSGTFNALSQTSRSWSGISVDSSNQ
ncbi:hypothetical protein ACFL2J_08175, partial [Candidatus Omnitrophota bacterium]